MSPSPVALPELDAVSISCGTPPCANFQKWSGGLSAFTIVPMLVPLNEMFTNGTATLTSSLLVTP